MAPLVWDEVGERFYQTGIDRGVLYFQFDEDSFPIVVPWNGLTEVSEGSSSEVRPFYFDGVKYLNSFIPGEFEGKLKAFTYPEEFDLINGVSPAHKGPGLDLYDQPVRSFSLSYRVRIGNDVDSELGYKIHILYNVTANPDGHSYKTSEEEVDPVEFSWTLTGVPQKLEGFRPTVHISIDSTKTDPDLMELLEEVLYGTDVSSPYLPTIQEIADAYVS